jgi:shikimate kinase
MGAGKTTVGQELAKRMNLSFIDLDTCIEARYYKTVSRLFAEKGEEAFRLIEYRMLREVAMFENVLISTGGGAPCFYDNMAYMNENGQTVYLKVSPAELARRLELLKHTRPLLNGRCGVDLLSFVSESLEKRSPYYMQAGIIFDVETMCTDNDVHRLAKALEKALLQQYAET